MYNRNDDIRHDVDIMSHDDIRFEIMSRLPLKTLLKLRSISKSWRDTIDSSDFRKLHLQNQLSKYSRNDDDIFFLQLIGSSYKELSLMSLDTVKWHDDFPSYKDFFRNNGSLELSVSVHGLICLYDSHSSNPIALCNPCLQEIKILPPSPSQRCRFPYRTVGVGYDDLKKDYKVVQFWYDKFSSDLSQQTTVVEVYSRKENRWRVLADHPFNEGYFFTKQIKHKQPSSSRSAAVAHWKGSKIGGDSKVEHVIMSFDMRSEAFRTIELPRVVYWWEPEVFVEEDSFFAIAWTGHERMTMWEYKGEWIEVGFVWVDEAFSTVVVRDCGSQEIIRCFKWPSSKVVACKGSFVSP